MLVLISYDIKTMDREGRTRLRKVAKICVNYGQRVQNSVFECLIDYSQYLKIKEKIIALMDQDQDSVRFYILGNKYENKVEHFGVKPNFAQDDVLIF